MALDPHSAPTRGDLPWLRHRARPRTAAANAPGAVEPSDALRDFITGRSGRGAARRPPTAPPTAPTVTPTRPTRPAAPPPPAPPRPAAPAPVSASLDLDAPAPAPSRAAAPAAPASLDLDLDAPVPSVPARPTVAEPLSGPPRRPRADVRVHAGERVLLTPAEPTITLSRLQSGIGALTIEAACSPEVGDLRLGCIYELFSGPSSTVQLSQGNRVAPPKSRRPVIVASRERFERVAIDLRQCTDLRRLVVYAFSESRTPLAWGGTLTATTLGGGRAELPLDTLQSGDVAVVLSIYNVHGEFVLRAEMQTLFGAAREAARAYGFDRITWLDDRTPVD